jgi:hypothetical protein
MQAACEGIVYVGFIVNVVAGQHGLVDVQDFAKS